MRLANFFFTHIPTFPGEQLAYNQHFILSSPFRLSSFQRPLVVSLLVKALGITVLCFAAASPKIFFGRIRSRASFPPLFFPHPPWRLLAPLPLSFVSLPLWSTDVALFLTAVAVTSRLVDAWIRIYPPSEQSLLPAYPSSFFLLKATAEVSSPIFVPDLFSASAEAFILLTLRSPWLHARSFTRLR